MRKSEAGKKATVFLDKSKESMVLTRGDLSQFKTIKEVVEVVGK